MLEACRPATAPRPARRVRPSPAAPHPACRMSRMAVAPRRRPDPPDLPAPPPGRSPVAAEGLFGRPLPMLLLQAREAVMKYFRPHLRAYDLTQQQWRILRVLALESGGIEMQELAIRSAIQPPSLSRTVPRMVERKLLQRAVHPHDQRRIMVTLAPAGRRLFDQVAVGAADIYATIEQAYGPERMTALYALLDALIAIAPAGDDTPEPPVD